MANLEYGSHTVDVATIPQASVQALLQQAFGHKLGNEVASAVTNRIRNEIGADATRDAVSAWRERNKEQVDAWTAELRAAVIADIMAGTLGVRQGGPRLDPVDKKYRELVLKTIATKLKSVGRKMPKKDEVVDFGNGVTRTLAEMVQNTEALEGAKLRQEAERLVKAEERATKQPKHEGPVDAASLGL